MKQKKFTGSNTVILALLLTSFAANVKAQVRIDYRLLVGEWSNAGKCNRERMVYTTDGYFQYLLNFNNRWSKAFSVPGIYQPIPNGIVIYNADGTEFRRMHIKELTASRLRFNTSEDKAETVLQKCPARYSQSK